jgi:hypothetical protein
MRSDGFQITGNELQAMVNEGLIGAKTSISQTNRCLTRQEVFNSVHCYAGDAPSGNFIPYSSWEIGGVQYTGPSPNLTCNFEYINPIRSSSVLFEMNQEGNPYLNVDLFGYVNGSPLRLDPANNLDGMFFGGPQYSPQMNSVVKVGNSVYVQANFGLNYAETPGNFGWNAFGYGFLEVYANGSLISDQNVYKTIASFPNLQSLSYTFTVQANTNYYIKAYSLVTYPSNICFSEISPADACAGINDETNGIKDGDCACCGGYGC